jgi:hypothetical protein
MPVRVCVQRRSAYWSPKLIREEAIPCGSWMSQDRLVRVVAVALGPLQSTVLVVARTHWDSERKSPFVRSIQLVLLHRAVETIER